ncbi:MAG: polymer-forming cytoskeletal protein [Pyrinomonadaceae bacterium]|nr:polymer-forming cytoskeletal protein [Pyrinomonadaceae bacterium]
MLRMGRNPKAEPNENEKQAAAPQAAYNTPASYNTPTAAAPPPAASPAYSNPQPPVQPDIERAPQTTRAMTETESLAREIKDGTMSGFVGGGTVLSGEAVFKGMLRVDGHLTGRISSEKGTLIVSSGGRVDADIQVATAKINGSVNGDIIASERLELGRTAEVHGNVQAPVLVIEQGAIFEGSCRMKSLETARKTELTEKAQAKDSPQRSSSVPPPTAARSAAPEAVKATNPA